MITDEYEEFCLSIVAGGGNAQAANSPAFCGCAQYLTAKRNKETFGQSGEDKTSDNGAVFQNSEIVQLGFIGRLIRAGRTMVGFKG